jgi:Phage integrase family
VAPEHRSNVTFHQTHLAKPENRRTVYSRVATAAIELLLFTGCRLSEVLTLRWDQVDVVGGTITLAETKSGRPQVIVINAPARRVLVQLQRAKSSDWVLPSTSDAKRPLSKAAIEAAWQRIRSAAKLEDVRLHDLRHTVGTYAGQSGANAFLVRDLLRHKDLSMTGRYVNRADDPVRTLSELVGERIWTAMAGRPQAELVQLKNERPSIRRAGLGGQPESRPPQSLASRTLQGATAYGGGICRRMDDLFDPFESLKSSLKS